MKELALNILDIAQNSIAAGANQIAIAVRESVAADRLTISVKDNGCGMEPEFLAKVTDPFTTTRKTRKVGMGIPLLKMEAEMSGGELRIESEKGKGTSLTACFKRSHIDRPPLGDVAGTFMVLIQGAPNLEFTYTRETDRGAFQFSTAQVRALLDGVPLSEPDVLAWIRGYVEEGESGVL
ncbi:MAG: ATP-binding protein [Peptococcaceae bacterium]|jgi:anti-sigma regulatory factor (Ser/Thr protein kinase)|nr:ATP-binding protein [Peptococcaceae bacterium]